MSAEHSPNSAVPANDFAAEGVQPLVGIIMGSQSDWTTMKHAADTLAALGIPHEVRIVSAHRTPPGLVE